MELPPCACGLPRFVVAGNLSAKIATAPTHSWWQTMATTPLLTPEHLNAQQLLMNKAKAIMDESLRQFINGYNDYRQDSD